MMKKKICALFTAAAIFAGGAFAGVPQIAIAAGTANNKVNVRFSAGIPGSFDMVDEQLTVRGNLAEKYFPEIAANEPDGVSFADALVCAHEKKYGTSRVKEYLGIVSGSEGSEVTKQFGHANAVRCYVNDTACTHGVSSLIKNRDCLYAGTSAEENGSFGYSYFEKRGYAVKVGKTVKVKACYKATQINDQNADPRAGAAALSNVRIVRANKKTGKLDEMTASTNSIGIASVSFKEPGDKYISLIGQADTGDGVNALAGAVAKVKVILAKTKITKKSATYTSATFKWKKVPGAKKYEIFKAVKKNGKFKKAGVTKKTKFKSMKLKEGKKYFYKVRAYAKTEGSAVRGQFSKTVSVRTKVTVKTVAPSSSSGGGSSASSSKSKAPSKKPSKSSSTIDRLKKLFDIFK